MVNLIDVRSRMLKLRDLMVLLDYDSSIGSLRTTSFNLIKTNVQDYKL